MILSTAIDNSDSQYASTGSELPRPGPPNSSGKREWNVLYRDNGLEHGSNCSTIGYIVGVLNR